MIAVFVTILGGVWASWYPIVSAHAKGNLKIETAILGIFILLTFSLSILATTHLIEMAWTKKRIYSQVLDILSESVIRSEM